MSSLHRLFSPIKIGKVEIKNRIAMAPMATSWANPDGTISDRLTAYHAARAKGGVGLIILEVATIDGMLPYVPNTIGLWDDKHVPAMRRFTDTIHAYGAKVIAQVSHPGPESLSALLHGIQPVGPSAVMCHSTKTMCRELAIEEIESIVKQFGEAALRAREAGCDGIELHAAHCYMLLGSFISPLRNKRTDAYGGSVHGRLKLLLEVVKSVRARAGDDFPITMRLSGDELVPGGRDIRETRYITPILAGAGVSAFHISRGAYPDRSQIIPPSGTPLGLNTAFSRMVKEVVDVPVMVVGRINDPRFAEDVLIRNEADMVVMGRALLADPELPNKAAEGRFDDIAPCTGCGVGCVRAAEEQRSIACVINPALGRERKMAITPAPAFKRVMVVGGGPGGLEAARVAALRGHSVTVYEKGSKIGGQLKLAVVPPMKQELSKWIEYLRIQLEKAGVEVRLNTEVTPELVGEVKPDAVVVATGGEPLIPRIAGINGEKVVIASDVLAAKVVPRGNVLVIGGGMVGCEIAELLADTGDNPMVDRARVTIVEMRNDIGMDMVLDQRIWLMRRLRECDVKIVTSAKVKEILDDGVIIERNGKEESIRGMDHILLAMGVKPVDVLSRKIEDKVTEIYVIGDAKQACRALEAIADGARVGRDI